MKKQGSILIVDDNQSVLNSLKLFLKHKFEKVYTEKKPDQILPVIRGRIDEAGSAAVSSGENAIHGKGGPAHDGG